MSNMNTLTQAHCDPTSVLRSTETHTSTREILPSQNVVGHRRVADPIHGQLAEQLVHGEELLRAARILTKNTKLPSTVLPTKTSLCCPLLSRTRSAPLLASLPSGETEGEGTQEGRTEELSGDESGGTKVLGGERVGRRRGLRRVLTKPRG